MKAPRFWYQSSGVWARLLLPLSGFYWLGAKVRAIGKKPYKAKQPVICVGNIVAGGAGKTPTALALASLIKAKGGQPCFVTRGYGGREQGPLKVDVRNHTATDVGDEALLLARVASTFVGRDRVAAIKMAEPYASHIILDDGLQNPNFVSDYPLMVVDAVVGVGNGSLIPAGPLRESLRSALKRVSAAVVIGEGIDPQLNQSLYLASIPCLRAHLQPDMPLWFPRDASFLAFAGIGRPEKFYQLCREAGLKLVKTIDFPDHHTFSESELSSLFIEAQKRGAILLTTDKDSVRLADSWRARIQTLPVTLIFENSQQITDLLKL